MMSICASLTLIAGLSVLISRYVSIFNGILMSVKMNNLF